MMMWGASRWGYSLTALSGSEMDQGYTHDIPIQAVQGDLEKVFNRNGEPPELSAQGSGTPGYLNSLGNQGIRTELTATLRTGMGRFSFTNQRKTSFLFHLDRGENAAQIESDREISGYATRNGRHIYFYARFQNSFSEYGVWRGKTPRAQVAQATGVSGIYVSFPEAKTQLMKVGMSFVSVVNARGNLNGENADWDFERIKREALLDWNEKLLRIEIQGGTEKARTLFYTSLYHAFLHPNIYNDINGDYLGFDDLFHHTQGRPQYADFSIWDTYRSWMPMVAMLFPKEASDMVQSLVNDGIQCGAMPRWADGNLETGVMEAGSSTPFVSAAYAFGARDFDTAQALRLMEKVERVPGTRCQGVEEHWGLKNYLEMGYLPVNTAEYLGRQTVSLALEYGVGQFALSQFARALGEVAPAQTYLATAQNWKNLFNVQSGLLQPKNQNGSWWNGFDSVHGHMQGYTEGNAVQYSWMVPFNLKGLFQKMGGNVSAVRRLDHFFEKLTAPNDVEGFNQPYSYIGNEPSFGVPWAYDWAGSPWKTQSVVRRMIDEVFMHGMPGAEDLGAGSSWVVWAMLGLYPEIPGVAGLAVGSPYFPKAVLHLGSARTLEISADGFELGPYVQSLKLNQSLYESPWLTLESLNSPHSRLSFKLGQKPSAWGADSLQLPPSFE